MKDELKIKKNIISCSFCKNEQNKKSKIIAGLSSVYICEKCVEMCNNILQEDTEKKIIKLKDFTTLYPEFIYKKLNNYVIGQKKAKKILSVTMYNHYKKILNSMKINSKNLSISKSNILIIGPTGSGKTFIAKTLSKILNIPLIVTNATSFIEKNSTKKEIESIILKLLQNCNYDIEKAENSIIYIDGIDKISKKINEDFIAKNISGEIIQRSLVNLIEGTTYFLKKQFSNFDNNKNLIKIDTSKILFICSGKFKGMTNIIKNRINLKKIYLIKKNIKILNNKEILKKILPEDFVKFGLIKEFISRFPIIINLNKPDKKMLYKILKKTKNSLIKQYKRLFMMENIDLEFDKKAIKEIVNQSLKTKLGIRGLNYVIEKSLVKIMYYATLDRKIKKIVISKNVIKNNLNPQIIYN
ncbi:MAG: ATP-dependent Clp protease ATP-binding subunit ClpX [Enterobacteriaceae bacterium]